MTKLFVVAALAGLLGQPETGVGAYYGDGIMQEVCERRVRNGWHDGVKLHCDWPCLVAGIEHDTLGRWVVVDVGTELHLCQVVDVGNEAHLGDLRERGEVIEVPYWLAMQAGWNGYQPGVRIWWIGGGDAETP